MNCEIQIKEKIEKNNEEIRKAKVAQEKNQTKLRKFEDDERKHKEEPYAISSLKMNVIEG